ncbi:hypothetical protein [Tuberibacillus sp. Marseille-P3662]|uniref:hypothetical protein n=1 Tax=Tuberibacillus sp. Marseille-P3662 TaxID=1965358 RepID=UPI000A1C8272|nr:hypothetical protein [Tuberibacillus sp. Marseille-P3662]
MVQMINNWNNYLFTDLDRFMETYMRLVKTLIIFSPLFTVFPVFFIGSALAYWSAWSLFTMILSLILTIPWMITPFLLAMRIARDNRRFVIYWAIASGIGITIWSILLVQGQLLI